MNREEIERTVDQLKTKLPALPPADWAAIVEEAVVISGEVEKLTELPLSDVEPIYTDSNRN
jgi:hypothetical protein